MQVIAPAKINLSLRVLGRRSDGFHEIETLIAPISLSDEIKIEERPGKQKRIVFRCDDPSVPQGRDNVVVRAATVFFHETQLTRNVSIALKKRIPHGAGLGGGSSDAASTLLALNELFKTNLPREALAKMAEGIGSDVPFFIFQSAAVCKGRGELVIPARLRKQLSLLLLKPAFGVSTQWAYSRWRKSHEIPAVAYTSQAFETQTFINDLERPVFEKFVFLAEIKMWLLKQPEVGAALMSGSGSTIFAVIRGDVDVDVVARRARTELDPELWSCACKTIG
jgi:4-diphosphocytidyl-2-C-methyl-D-erythritol kinase